jgi:hypothetical protein
MAVMMLTQLNGLRWFAQGNDLLEDVSGQPLSRYLVRKEAAFL